MDGQELLRAPYRDRRAAVQSALNRGLADDIGHRSRP
ncbi:hypothetical protein [Streptomyces sp. NPDC051704]